MKTYEELIEEILFIVSVEKQQIIKENLFLQPIFIEVNQTNTKTIIYFVEQINNYKSKKMIFSLSNELGLYFDSKFYNGSISKIQTKIEKVIKKNKYLLKTLETL